MNQGTELKYLLYLPRYTYEEAARLALVKSGAKFKRWIPKSARSRNGHDEFYGRTPARNLGNVSFLDLIEVALIKQLRSQGLSLQLIRKAWSYCVTELEVERPFVSHQFKFSGEDIFIKTSRDEFVEVGRKAGQHAIEKALDPFLRQLEHDEAIELVRAWWPMGKDEPVLISPKYGFGRPVIENTGVRTETIFEQFQAGADAAEIADNFRIDLDAVKSALEFEQQRSA